MARGMSKNAAKFAPARPRIEIMQFPSWCAWEKYLRWQFHCGTTLLYLSHKTADDARVFVRFEVIG